MEVTLLSSIIGATIFAVIMFLGFKYANGKWNVSKSKQAGYLKWADSHGKTIKKAIIVISIIYGISMGLQILSQI